MPQPPSSSPPPSDSSRTHCELSRAIFDRERRDPLWKSHTKIKGVSHKAASYFYRLPSAGGLWHPSPVGRDMISKQGGFMRRCLSTTSPPEPDVVVSGLGSVFGFLSPGDSAGGRRSALWQSSIYLSLWFRTLPLASAVQAEQSSLSKSLERITGLLEYKNC